MRSKIFRLRQSRFIRFLVSGLLNTATTYVIYLLLLSIVSYQASFTVAYLTGIVLAYFLNRLFVFQANRGAISIVLLPVVYLIQYLFGMIVLWIWIDVAQFNQKIGPLLVVALSIPLTYLLTKNIFVKN